MTACNGQLDASSRQEVALQTLLVRPATGGDLQYMMTDPVIELLVFSSSDWRDMMHFLNDTVINAIFCSGEIVLQWPLGLKLAV